MALDKATGVVIVRLNGQSIRSKEGAQLDMGGFERTVQYADGLPASYTEKPIAATVTATLLHTSSSDLSAIRDLVDGTLIFECDNGVVFTVRGAICTKPPSLTGGEGEVSVEFMGSAAVEG